LSGCKSNDRIRLSIDDEDDSVNFLWQLTATKNLFPIQSKQKPFGKNKIEISVVCFAHNGSFCFNIALNQDKNFDFWLTIFLLNFVRNVIYLSKWVQRKCKFRTYSLFTTTSAFFLFLWYCPSSIILLTNKNENFQKVYNNLVWLFHLTRFWRITFWCFSICFFCLENATSQRNLNFIFACWRRNIS